MLSGVVNNPRATWLQYFGLPEDLDEWTLEDARSAMSSYVSSAAAASTTNGGGAAASVSASAASGAGATTVVARDEREITIDDFKNYLQRVGEPYRFMAASRQSAAEGAEGSADGRDGAPSSSAAASAVARSAAERAAELSHVPQLCFAEDFDLSNPETFAFFSPPDQAHATSMVTLEKLNGYLDTVELTLLAEVSSRSEGFFDALKSYEVLTNEVAAGCAQIEALRSKMRLLEANLVDKSLRLPVLVRRRANTVALAEKMRLVHVVWATQPTIQELLTARDFPRALELISSSQQLLSTELSGIHALRKLSEQLSQTKRQITTMMGKDLLQLALGHAPDAEPPSPPREALASELETRMLPLVSGLLRLRLLHDTLDTLEDILMKSLRSTVKSQLQRELTKRSEQAKAAADAAAAAAPSAEAGLAANGSAANGVGTAGRAEGDAAGAADPAAMAVPPSAADAIAAKSQRPVATQLRELSVDEFDSVMGGVIAPVMVLLRRSSVVHSAISKALAVPSIRQAAASEGDDGSEYVERVGSRSADSLLHTCELSQERYARLLKARKEVHAKLTLVDFVRMNRSVTEFVRDVAHLCPAAYSMLQDELKQHAAEFMRVSHEQAKGKLEAAVEIEQWKQVEVAPEFQQIADAFARNQVPTLAESELMRLREHEPTEGAAHPRELVIEGTGYKVVGSTLLLLASAAYYMQCVASIPIEQVGTLAATLLPALLKLFHSLTYKQVLCAGAMRPDSAGLKSILAKHLALASQSLGLMLALLPHLKAILSAYVPAAQKEVLLAEMDSALSDYDKHQTELFNKFVTMLEERRRGYVKMLGDQLAPSEERRRPEATSCVKQCVHDITNMHNRLQPLLSRAQLLIVFEKILTDLDGGMLAAYKAADVSALFARQCIVADVLHLRQEVGKLHLALPNGCCPELVAFAKSLSVT